MKRILFITPTFARTGSEMVLWYLITSLNSEKYKIFLFSIRKGELVEILPDHINKSVSYKYSKKWHKIAFRILLKLCGVKNLIGYQLTQIQKKFKADLWFVNTIMIPNAHLAAKDLNVKVATYFHEMDHAYGFIKNNELQRIINFSYCCIGCAEIVVNKIEELGHNNIKLQNSFINEQIISVDRRNIATIKKALGIAPTDFVWIISGTAQYMKGLDQVLPVVQYFKGKQVKIVWIGSNANTGLEYYVRSTAEKVSPGMLIFTGPLSDNYYDYLAMGNGLLMLSKEECFSLVMLEAAYLELPIVAFNSGIVDNFIEEGMGKVVNAMDTLQLCKEMEWVQNNQSFINKKKLKIKALEFTVRNQVPLFENMLEEILEDENTVI
jgi:glycosyltransferase involved in cell wall biosynthesis